MARTDNVRASRLALRARPNHTPDMPRRPRDEARGAIHHVVPTGSGGESIVRDDLDRQALLQRLERAVVRHGWQCFAYCILDTHFHLLIRTAEPNLGLGMQWLLAPYARDFNERHKRRGNLFHTRFYSTRITSDDHLTAALVYIHLNPVRAGVVESPELWRWSSYAATIGDATPPRLLAKSEVLRLIDEHPASARLRVRLAVTETLERDRRRVGVRHGV
jgi:REP-associated tyrosine transposase